MSTRAITAPSGPSLSHQTTTCMPQDLKTARSRCGRTARGSTACGVESVVLLLRNGALTRRSTAVRKLRQPPSFWIFRTRNWRFLAGRAHRRVPKHHCQRVRRIDLHPHPSSHCRCRQRRTMPLDPRLWRNFSDDCANVIFRSAGTKRTDDSPQPTPFQQRHPPETSNTTQHSGRHHSVIFVFSSSISVMHSSGSRLWTTGRRKFRLQH